VGGKPGLGLIIDGQTASGKSGGVFNQKLFLEQLTFLMIFLILK